MKNKLDFQENMAKWKSLSSSEEKDKFLKQMEKEIAEKSPEEFRKSLKEVHAAIIQLHRDVFKFKFKA